MKLANIFPSQALMAPVLTAALSLASIFSPSTGNAEQPAKVTTVSTPPATAASTEANRALDKNLVGNAMAEAIRYSGQGVSLIFVLGKNDSFEKYKPDVAGVLSSMRDHKVPTKFFGVKSGADKTYAFIIIDGLTFRGQQPQPEGYAPEELDTLGGIAINLYREWQKEQKTAMATTLPTTLAAAPH